MGVDLARSIRSDPNLLEILRQIVATGGTTTNVVAVGAVKGEQQLNIGGCSQPQSTGGYREITIDNSIIQDIVQETAVTESIPFVNSSSSSATNDHQYFSNAMSSPSSSSVLFSSSSNINFDLESLLQPQPMADLFSNNDTADQYFQNAASSINSGIISSAKSPNSMVPASPILNFDPDFPALGDDILQQALQSLGDLTKFAENTTSTTQLSTSSIGDQSSSNVTGFDFLQNDDYADLVWEESFAQLFPSLS